MARNEQDREDLVREATGLKNRIEWNVPGEPEPVVTGLKSSGNLSLYFGQDPVYQFDVAGQLRRAYVNGFLYRTQGTTLARIHRERTEAETSLMRYDLTPNELSDVLTSMTARVASLREALASGRATELRRVCEVEDPGFVEKLDTVLTASRKLAPAMPTKP